MKFSKKKSKNVLCQKKEEEPSKGLEAKGYYIDEYNGGYKKNMRIKTIIISHMSIMKKSIQMLKSLENHKKK